MFIDGIGCFSWTHWTKSPVPKRWHLPLQILGFIILIYLAIIYKGGPTGDSWMQTQWWGILGLIGWANLANALIFLLAKGRLGVMVLVWLVFNSLSVLSQQGIIPEFTGVFSYFSTIANGTIPAFTTAGIVASLAFDKWSEIKIMRSYLVLILLGIACLAYGFGTRSLWGISKLQGTPSWLAVCSGMGFLLFVILHYMADRKKRTDWAKYIAPAGTATLTCYLLPYIIYPLRHFLNFRLPDVLKTGLIGLLGSLLFAYLVVLIGGVLEKKGFKLKL